MDAAFFDALMTFFAQSWINKTDPIRMNKEGIEKNGALFTLVMKISATAYVDENQESKQFIRHFCEVIHRDFWDSFTLLPEIETFFTSKPQVTQLLMAHTNKNDLGYLLQLIKNNHKTALNGEEAVRKSKDKIQTLLSYLDEHAGALIKNPAPLRPLMRIILGDSDWDYLPKVPVLPNLSKQSQGLFWYFLSERLPLDEKSCGELIENIAGLEVNETLDQKMLTPLFQLPAYMSLDYINQALKFKPGRYQLDDCEAVLKELHEAGLAFNQFLTKKNMIESSTRFIKPLEPDVFRQWVSHFKQIPVVRAKELFNLLKDCDVSLPALLPLVKAYSTTNKMSLELLKQCLIIDVHLEKMSSHKEKWAFLNEQRQALLHSQNLAKAKELYGFVEVMKDSPADLARIETQFLWDIWQRKSNDRGLVKECLTLMKQIKLFDKQYPQIKLMDHYLKSTMDSQANEFFKDFFEVINANENKGLDGDREKDLLIMASLVNAWFKTKTIKNKQQLSISLDVVSEAKRLNQTQQWHEYFGEVICKKQQQRQQLMQHLHHGILNLGEDFSRKCTKEYEHLAQAAVPNIPEKLGNDYQTRSQLRQCFRQLIHFTRELVQVASAPFMEAPANKQSHRDNQVMADQKAYFTRQQQKYAGFWLTSNRARKDQARDLFLSLNNIAVHSKEDFYEQSLKAIAAAQQKILLGDRGTQYNKKGYSRLYDITVHMFLKVSGDLLADKDIAPEAKVFLTKILNEQTNAQVNILYERLPHTSALKKAMGPLITRDAGYLDAWAPGSVPLAKLEGLLKTHAASVPKPLKYLINNLDCLIQLPGMALEREGVSFNAS